LVPFAFGLIVKQRLNACYGFAQLSGARPGNPIYQVIEYIIERALARQGNLRESLRLEWQAVCKDKGADRDRIVLGPGLVLTSGPADARH